MSRPTSVVEDRWLALVATLPAQAPAMRMRVLRTLEGLGAAVLREGVYLLPDSAPGREGLLHLADYVAKNGGSAHVLQATALGAAQTRALRGLFDRSARYDELVKVIESLRVGFGVADPSALARVLAAKRRELEAIVALDFFPSEARARAERALAQAEAQVRRLLFPQQPGGASPGAASDAPPLGRVWATRLPLWADRLASAWLVRRFIDPEATLRWLDKGEPCPAEAIGFAFDGARFANSAARVTFEELLAHFGLEKNAALARIGAIVHFLEVKGTAVPEAAGVQTLLQGAQRRATTIDQLLAEAEKAFDLLYEAFESKA
ncbi:MAG: chromate resistance protein [Burkholderiales bacterium]|nr:chromate resistance protein [Burkholderiales bacterium]